ncbi:MAG: chorismate synthase, partial [Endomicrobiia bacterium]
DIRNVQERASARETSVRVAVGAICKKFLSEFDIKIFSAVEEIGGVKFQLSENEIIENYSKIEESCVRTPDKKTEEKMVEVIKKCFENGDTVGGVFKIVVTGLPPGIGNYIQWDKKLDANIAKGLLSIQAVKGVEFGRGFEFGKFFGSQVHDEIFYDEKNKRYYRKTNNAGGIEGGMTNGQNLVIRVVMKPIPSLNQPLKSVDIKTKKQTSADIVRSDVCAVPSCSVIAESVVAYTVSDAFLEKFAGDNIKETKQRYNEYIQYLKTA